MQLPHHEVNEEKKWQFNDFLFGGLLGEGQYGKVYLAREKESNRKVALKVMFVRRFIKNGIENQLRNEIEIHSHLIHNRITRVYGAFFDRERVGIVMEYAPCGTLFNIMIKNKWTMGMPMKYVQQVATQVYAALSYCHAHNVMHRDLKPENVLVFNNISVTTSKLEVKLADFGWSVPIIDQHYRNTTCGTVSYLAPEQNKKKEYNLSAEAWAFGVLIFELVAGIAESEEGFLFYFKLLVEESVSLKELQERLASNNLDTCEALTLKRFTGRATPATINLCKRLLKYEPKERATLASIKFDPFFTEDYSMLTI